MIRLTAQRHNGTMARLCIDIIYKRYCFLFTVRVKIVMIAFYLISYILFIFLVERIQLFSRAVCPKRIGDVSWA